MQNGKLMMGSIFENITISAPWLTLDEAWEAAEAAGLAQDIREMPMGMQTIISEGQGGISGGQKQRMLIARAIAPKPKILIFDEATSALDNLTQKKVTQALDSYKCTRLVIAHRLSTIQACDRILVLRGGKITEDGTYDELIANQGFFAELVERQRLDLGGEPETAAPGDSAPLSEGDEPAPEGFESEADANEPEGFESEADANEAEGYESEADANEAANSDGEEHGPVG
jgi:ABC-type multidrug transport system ATPase subunit